MPEAPEVHELASFLDARMRGRRIVGFDIALGKIVKSPDAGAAALVGSTVTAVSRIAKMIDIAVLAGGHARHAIVHFGHDGWVLWHDVVPEGIKRVGAATLLARVRLDDGSGFDLTDSGQWKALTLNVVDRAADVSAVAKLGPDALDPGFGLERFAGILAGRKKQIKALLQDQTAMAGIGNAYSDEILHAARIAPVTHAAALSADEVARLYGAMRATLFDATAARYGVPPEDLKATKRAALTVHRRTGAPCPVCGDSIREITLSGAAAQYCPTCQNAGVALG